MPGIGTKSGERKRSAAVALGRVGRRLGRQRRRSIPATGLYTKKYTDRRAGFRAYPTAFQCVRRRSRNSTPHIGSSLGRSHRVGHRRRPEGSPETNYERYLLRNFVPSFPVSLVTSGVGSDVLSSGRSGVLRGPVRRRRRSVLRFLTNFLRSLSGSFGRSFPRSPAGDAFSVRRANDHSGLADETPPRHRGDTALTPVTAPTLAILFLVLGSWFFVPRFLSSGSRLDVRGLRSAVYGLRSTVYGTQSIVQRPLSDGRICVICEICG